MEYRRFPKIQDKEISVLGFGAMRLPVIGGKNECIDYDKTLSLIQTAWEHGINYYDTAYVYHGEKSEEVLGKALQELNIRDKVYIADKSPVWLVKDAKDWQKLLDTQLTRLNTDHIDFYLMHALNSGSWKTILEHDGLSFLEKAKKEGKILHAGFSFHDELDVFKTIVDGYESWEFCQIQYNYLDTEYQAGLEGLNYANDREIGVIVMEPLRGGMLANVAPGVQDIFSKTGMPRYPAEWALRYVWEQQGVITALSGMNDEIQILANCAAASAAKPNSLPSSQIKIIEEAAQWFKDRILSPCTGCRYCMPCPKGVFIPEILAELNRISMAGGLDNPERHAVSAAYRKLKAENHGADLCVSCKICESKCPQHIRISSILKDAEKALF